MQATLTKVNIERESLSDLKESMANCLQICHWRWKKTCVSIYTQKYYTNCKLHSLVKSTVNTVHNCRHTHTVVCCSRFTAFDCSGYQCILTCTITVLSVLSPTFRKPKPKNFFSGYSVYTCVSRRPQPWPAHTVCIFISTCGWLAQCFRCERLIALQNKSRRRRCVYLQRSTSLREIIATRGCGTPFLISARCVSLIC